MNIVLLSGGSGKRLWPLSNETQSKQFLKLLPKQTDESESMVQRVYRQIKAVDPSASITLSTNTSQVDSIRRQLGSDVDVVVEPERRDTFPAIALSAAYLHYKKGLPTDNVMVVLPIDVFAEEGYFKCLAQMERAVEDNISNICLMGATPTYPSEKYGYIIPVMDDSSTVQKVLEFKEKPSLEAAEQYILRGGLWNCGVFAMRIGYMLDIAARAVDFADFDELLSKYGELKKTSIDYEVIEKADSIGVVSYTGKWKDLGTWNTLTEEMDKSIVGRDVLVADNCTNTHVLNMLDIPIIVSGVDNAVVVASHDGILVSDKGQSSYLKPLADSITQRPMYEQRRWGDYRVIDYTENVNSVSLVKRLHINPGKSISYQYHNQRSEIWTIVSGDGIFTLDDVSKQVHTGDVLTIPVGAKHKIEAISDLTLIEVQLGTTKLEEEDIVRLQ